MLNFSIIIPYQTATPYLWETLEHIAKLRRTDFEVILLPDEDFYIKGREAYKYSIKIEPTGKVSPAVKRDLGAKVSRGIYLAFIDDDAFPAPDWLTNVIKHFDNPQIAAVGGPQITPEKDGFWQKVSGATFLSPLNGKSVYRYTPYNTGFCVEDWPSVNLIVRKEDFHAVGGFDSNYYPGEDTKLCLDLVEKQRKKIIYEPQAKVFHHRRSGLLNHLKQIGNYGLHRGYFAKTFPRTSFKVTYFIPSCFFLFVCIGWLLLFWGPAFSHLYLFLWSAYLSGLLISTFVLFTKLPDFRVALATIPYVTSTHFWYGWRFLKGYILVKDLKSQLGR